MTTHRRRFLKLAGGGLAALPLFARAAAAPSTTTRRVVVVGGGFGGAIAAKFVRLLDPGIEVTLIERNRQHVSCPFSNHVIAGLRPLAAQTIGYDALAARHGIRLVIGEAAAIDPATKEVVLKEGRIGYDRLIVSPGIDFRHEEIEGYDPARTPARLPHAWKAGAQTLLLKQQLEAMPDGGRVVIGMPLAPYRCPPGPYERVCLVAAFLKQHKPRAKLILLDANPEIVSLAAHFKKAWDVRHPDMVEYLPAMRVTRVDDRAKTLFVEGIEGFAGDVVNFIPPQRAATLLVKADLVGPDKHWCPVDARTFESTLQPNIHIIGDAAQAGAMPKSGYAANSQAKVCAMNVVALMNDRPIMDLSGINVCYSAIDVDAAVSIAAVYRGGADGIVAVPGAGGASPLDFSMATLESTYAESWFRNILAEMST